jgi:hypothetical protein
MDRLGIKFFIKAETTLACDYSDERLAITLYQSDVVAILRAACLRQLWLESLEAPRAPP